MLRSDSGERPLKWSVGALAAIGVAVAVLVLLAEQERADAVAALPGPPGRAADGPSSVGATRDAGVPAPGDVELEGFRSPVEDTPNAEPEPDQDPEGPGEASLRLVLLDDFDEEESTADPVVVQAPGGRWVVHEADGPAAVGRSESVYDFRSLVPGEARIRFGRFRLQVIRLDPGPNMHTVAVEEEVLRGVRIVGADGRAVEGLLAVSACLADQPGQQDLAATVAGGRVEVTDGVGLFPTGPGTVTYAIHTGQGVYRGRFDALAPPSEIVLAQRWALRVHPPAGSELPPGFHEFATVVVNGVVAECRTIAGGKLRRSLFFDAPPEGLRRIEVRIGERVWSFEGAAPSLVERSVIDLHLEHEDW